METYSVIDLFAGAGGLSLGFTQTGRFSITMAAENNKNAQNTYKKNHPNVEVLDDVRQIDYAEILKKYGPIDVVIGGPPCQGFSNANRQKAQAISTNNSLVKEYVRAVCELRPKVFVMENVGMLRSAVHRFYYSKKDQRLIDSLEIELRKDKLLLLPSDYCGGKAAEYARSLSHCSDYRWPEKEYEALNVLYHQRRNPVKFAHSAEKYEKRLLACADRWIEHYTSGANTPFREEEYYLGISLRSYFKKTDREKSQDTVLLYFLEQSIMIQRMLRHYQELQDNEIITKEIRTDEGIYANVYSYPVFEYVQKVLQAAPYGYHISADVLNAADYGAPQKRERYIVLGTRGQNKPVFPAPIIHSENYRTVYDAIADLETVKPTTEVGDGPVQYAPKLVNEASPLSSMRNSTWIYNHVVTATRETAKKRYESLQQGQNFHDLDDKLKSTYTDAKRTQNTIYLRLRYDEPSGTVVNVRKSMWIHPVLDRALSIREAARLQTFPDNFVFTGTKDSQYQQVGNAVPPMLANAIAGQVLKMLDEMRNG